MPRGIRPQNTPSDQQKITRSRLGSLWVAMTAGAVVLLLLLIFILENEHSVDVAYFGVHGHIPLGAALLLAAVFGVLLVVIPGAGRILQLRRSARRLQTTDQAPGTGSDQPPAGPEPTAAEFTRPPESSGAQPPAEPRP